MITRLKEAFETDEWEKIESYLEDAVLNIDSDTKKVKVTRPNGRFRVEIWEDE